MAKGMHRAPSKRHSKWLIMMMVVGMFVALAAPASAGPAPKVDVCHSEGNGSYHLINISENAFQTHLDHGDASPGEFVPGMLGMYFGEDCSTVSVAYATGDVYWTSRGGSGTAGIHTVFYVHEGSPADPTDFGSVHQAVPNASTRIIDVSCVLFDGSGEVNWGGIVTAGTVASEVDKPIIGWAKDDGSTDMIGGYFGSFPGNPDPCSSAALTWNGSGIVTSGSLEVHS